MDYVLRTKGLSKKYADCQAVDRVSVTVNKGDIYGLVGKNGAGKTTIFKMILGLSEYTSGSVSIDGSQNRKELFANRSKVGFFVGSNFYGYLSGRANLEYYAAAKGLKGKALKEEVDRVLKVVGLTDGKEKQKAKGYSLGMKQRLGIGNAILGNPDILILDEPTNGLDPQGIADIRHMIRRFRDEFGMTVIVSSHILGELENTADRFGIVHEGVIAKEITQEDLSAKRPEVELTVSAGNLERAKSILAENGIDILKEGKEKVTLEDYYFELIGGSAE